MKEFRINEEIRVPYVRVIDGRGNQQGVMDIRDALRMGEMQGLDLVEVAPNADPPVCRLLDVGKFKYEQKKKEQESRAKQVKIKVKEIKLRTGTDRHDLETKAKKVREFLEEGNKVKVTVRFRGREISRPELAKPVLVSLVEMLGEIVNIESQPRLEGRTMIMMLGPVQKGGQTPVPTVASPTAAPDRQS